MLTFLIAFLISIGIIAPESQSMSDQEKAEIIETHNIIIEDTLTF